MLNFFFAIQRFWRKHFLYKKTWISLGWSYAHIASQWYREISHFTIRFAPHYQFAENLSGRHTAQSWSARLTRYRGPDQIITPFWIPCELIVQGRTNRWVCDFLASLRCSRQYSSQQVKMMFFSIKRCFLKRRTRKNGKMSPCLHCSARHEDA